MFSTTSFYRIEFIYRVFVHEIDRKFLLNEVYSIVAIRWDENEKDKHIELHTNCSLITGDSNNFRFDIYFEWVETVRKQEGRT